MSSHDRSADQIVFRWDTDNLSGTTGFGPVAWSCAPERADAVFRTAAPLLRATGEATAPALLRLENGDRILLVHRAPWREAGGRAGTVCHALMGPADLLDPATCLGLHPWSWEGGDLPLAEVRGALPPVPGSALLPAADAGMRLLSDGLAPVRRELVGAVAEFLRHPKAGFTFLDPSGGAAHRVLWGLYGLFGGRTARRWTFATHDTVESDLLRFVFVSRWTGEASGSGARRRADPLERCGDRAESVAERLVRHHLREEYAVGAALRRAADRHRAARGGPVTWLALAEAALSDLPPDRPPARFSGRLPDPPSNRPLDQPPGRPLDQSPPRPAAPPPRRAPAGPPVPVVAPEWPAPSEERSRTRRWRGGGSTRRRGPADDELLRALRAGTGGYEALTALMGEVAERWPSWNRERRAALCAILLDRELFVTDRAGALRAPDDVRAANAASLYRWAVRPLLDDPALAARVTDLLPRLSTGPHRAARAAVRQITQSPSPGLPEPAWQALLRAASLPPGTVGDPGGAPAPPRRTAGRGRPAGPCGRPGPRAGSTPRTRLSPEPRGRAAPERAVPGVTVPGRSASEKTVPGTAVPGTAVAGRTTSGRTALGRIAPGTTVRRRTASERTAPGRTTSRRAAPGRTVLGKGARTRAPPVPDVRTGPGRGAAARPGPPGPPGPTASGRVARGPVPVSRHRTDPASRRRAGRPRVRTGTAAPSAGTASRSRGARRRAPRPPGRPPGTRGPTAGPPMSTVVTPASPPGTPGATTGPAGSPPGTPASTVVTPASPPGTPGAVTGPPASTHTTPVPSHTTAGSPTGSPTPPPAHRCHPPVHRHQPPGRRHRPPERRWHRAARRGPGGGPGARPAGRGIPREGAGPGGPEPEWRPMTGGRPGEAPLGHRPDPTPPPPAHPPRSAGEGARDGSGRPPGDRRPPASGPDSRGGADPPGGADRRPFLVVGAGTGTILALVGVIIVLISRSCA
ncbi:hypothetical protein LUW75_03460 [Streptomyces sp. MRC013]|uniref:hypothetical protein n=1 Tax=Streptomyces sp. MRC013 TaxID=2898276 RepID=UPI002026B4FF|nr:hypothetical protein [Streptomyces sp. MRC013]URM89221.1 hypothetical protein LUW75_03460 [Streptomyces sp. MRC013]